MDIWNEETLYRLNRVARVDDHYLWLEKEMEDAAQGYLDIKKKLNDAECEALDRYISLCEEMEYRKSQLAYVLGLLDRT